MRVQTARRAARGALRAVLWGMAVAHVVEALELRRRRRRVLALPDGTGHPPGKVDVVSVDGANVDDATRAAAWHAIESSGAQLIDLVPGDLPAQRAIRLLRRVQPQRLGADPFYAPGGTHEAVALHPSLSERMGTDGSESRDRGELVRLTLRAQRHAPTTAGLRLAPRLRSAPWSPRDRWRELEEATAFAWPYGALAPVVVGMETAHLWAMTVGLLVCPPAALAALATWSAQPAAVFAGGPWRPPGLAKVSLLRLPHVWSENLRTTLAGVRATQQRETQRATEPVPAAPPVEALLEPRRETCPWCGSPELVGRLDVSDLLQHKPGEFHLDECVACGHIFQNPALTPDGLDYVYEDAYDGIGEELAETSFAALAPLYRRRVETLARFTEPRAWLDVGTGHAHFCLAARQRWPEATFDGLDMSDTVEEAQRRGRVDTAYRGTFPELADGLPRSYDVVSMHHYLEHTREPRRELAAAAKVVEPGGFLMVEVPDPASPWARRLGRYWWQWGQPQHQHFVRCEELVEALGEAGFDVVSVERGAATMGGELFNAVGLVLQQLARSPHLPWLPPLSGWHRAKRLALYAAAVPAMVVTKVADELKDARLRRPDATTPGNAYRVVARRR